MEMHLEDYDILSSSYENEENWNWHECQNQNRNSHPLPQREGESAMAWVRRLQQNGYGPSPRLQEMVGRTRANCSRLARQFQNGGDWTLDSTPNCFGEEY